MFTEIIPDTVHLWLPQYKMPTGRVTTNAVHMPTLQLDIQTTWAVQRSANSQIHRELMVTVPGREAILLRGGISSTCVINALVDFWPNYCLSSYLESIPYSFKQLDTLAMQQSLKDLREANWIVMQLSMLCPRGGYTGLGGDFDRFLYPEGGDMRKLWNCKQPQGGELWPNAKKSGPGSQSHELTSHEESSHILQEVLYLEKVRQSIESVESVLLLLWSSLWYFSMLLQLGLP